MTRRLRRNVLLRNGTYTEVLLKGSAVPEWAEGRLSDRHITEGDDESPSAVDGEVQPPPLKGPGSSRAAWAAYAESQGVTVTPDMTKADIQHELD
ncbi:MAG TPA: hypothetical protein VK611_26890 [Acidimicrobiales bacterium]|nr:hypothetical protein [Acidimicrobiales bacterium]